MKIARLKKNSYYWKDINNKNFKKKKQKFISGESPIRLRFLPTRRRSGLFFKYGKYRISKRSTLRKRPIRDRKKLIKWIAIEKEKEEKAAQEKLAREKGIADKKDDKVEIPVENKTKNLVPKPVKYKYKHKRKWIPKKKILRLINLWVPAGKMFYWWMSLDFVNPPSSFSRDEKAG